MENNSLSYVVIFIMILIGCVFISVLNINKTEIMNIIYNETNITYEAIIYKNNKVEVAKKDCSGELCVTDKQTHSYSKDKINEFIDYINTYEVYFIIYEPFKTSSYVIYNNKTNKALYDDKIEDDIMLRTKTKQLLDGNY